MSYDCYCDYDPASVFSVKTVTARKRHQCCECRRVINPGETYRYAFGVWSGDASSLHTCSHCYEIQNFVSISIPCFCWEYGNMIECAEEAIADAYYRAKDEVRGLRTGFYRRVIAGRRAAKLARLAA
jgi:RNase P subunit RPR2